MSLMLLTLIIGLLLMIAGVVVMFIENKDNAIGATINEAGLAITIVAVVLIFFGFGA